MSEDRLETGWSCNHSGRIVDVGRGVIRCGCGHFSESLETAVDRLRAELEGQLGAYLMCVHEITGLREALRKYGRHILDYSGTAGCRVGITDTEEMCRCGFTKALASTGEEDEPPFEGKWTGIMGPAQEDKP